MKNLKIRELKNSDIALIANYWITLSDEQMLDMGVDKNKLPDAIHFSSMLERQMKMPIEEKNSYCLIWEVDGQPCGHCNTNPTTFGEEANFHVHLWNTKLRKKGFGTQLIQASLSNFFNVLHLKRLIGETYANNPGPNKLLKKIGFTLKKTYETTPGSINFKQLVNRWEITDMEYKTLYNHQSNA